MKAILISTHSQWVELILKFIKNVEIRKGTAIGKAITRLIKEQGVAPMLLYCTKGKPYLMRKYIVEEYECGFAFNDIKCNGKVIARYNATAEEIKIHFLNKQLTYRIASRYEYTTKSLSNSQLKKSSCLSNDEMNNYFKYVYDKNVVGTAIHIHDLEIFDRPKELSEFKSYKKNIVNTKINGMVFETELDNSLTKAPQSWCYVEVEDEE